MSRNADDSVFIRRVSIDGPTLVTMHRGPAQPGLLYLRGLSTDKVFSLTVERVPHTENVVRPLTFALEMSVAEASEDLFMLRIAGALSLSLETHRALL